MAGSLNKVCLIGHLGADPEVKRMNNGNPIVNLRMATSETWRDKTTGERRERTEWHRIVIFNEGLCKIAEQYLKKGALIYIEGALQTRKWQDQKMLDRVGDSGGSSDRDVGNKGFGTGTTQRAAETQQRQSYDMNDEVPF